MLFVFALPNVVPTPPGTSTVLGVPMVILSTQLMLGMRPWLPNFIARRSMTRDVFARIVARILPWLQRIEGLMRPGLSVLARPPYEYAVGALCLLLSIVVLLPIPLGNMLPAAAISLFALGILERNGVWVLAGLATTLVSAVLVSGVIYGLIEGARYILARWFG
jgi:hypothetical protein